MENDFRNLTAKVWANLDNPIKSYDFSKIWLISCMPPSQVALCYFVMSQQYNCLNGTVHTFQFFFFFFFFFFYYTFYENASSLPSTFILRYVRAKMIVHAFMIELDQLDLISKKK